MFGSRTFVPISWMCHKQASVSHSTPEAEVISSDAGLRMVGIPALDLWDLVTEVFHFSPKCDLARGHFSREACEKHSKGWKRSIMFLRQSDYLSKPLCCTSLRTMRQ